MIRVKIEMCPLGDERDESVREIGRMYIANVGGDAKRGDYSVAVCRKGTSTVPAEIIVASSGAFRLSAPHAARSASVVGYPRLAYNVWRLIARALLACFPEERAMARKDTLCDDASVGAEPTDEQALELGREILGMETCDDPWIVEAGREAWLRGARPRGF